MAAQQILEAYLGTEAVPSTLRQDADVLDLNTPRAIGKKSCWDIREYDKASEPPLPGLAKGQGSVLIPGRMPYIGFEFVEIHCQERHACIP